MKAIIPIITLSALTMMLMPACAPAIIGLPLPRPPGVGLSVLPHGYRTIHVGGVPYYHNGSHWYRRSHGGYIGCSRPHGYRGHAPNRHVPRPPRLPGLPSLPHIGL